MPQEIKIKVDEEFKFLYTKGEFKASWGGRGGMKSWGYAQAILILSTQYRIRVLCCREVQKSIKDSVKKLLADWIKRMSLDADFYITQTEIIHKRTGSEILFSGLQDHTSASIKSFEGVDICWVEEAHSITQKSLDILLPTIRKKGSELWFTWNPDLPTDPVDKMFRGEHCPETAIVKKFDYRDNPYLPQKFIDEAMRLKEEDPERYYHVYEGHYRAQGDNQLISFKAIEASTKRELERLNVPVLGAVDPAREGSDRMAFVVRKGNEILFEKKWPKVSDFFPVAQEIARKCIQLEAVAVNVDKVGMGEGFVDIFKKASGGQFDIKTFNGGLPAKDSIYFNKRAECWDLLRIWIEDTGVIPNTAEWIEDLAVIKYFYTEKTQKRLISKDKIKSEGGKSPDMGDALSMTFDPLLITKKKPKKKQVIRKWQE